MRLGGYGSAGGSMQPGRDHPPGECLGDPGVVRRGVRERFERELAPQAVVGPLAALERREDVAVAGRRGHDRDVGVVLRGGPDHRRPADVDLLDELIDRDARPLERGGERVEVDDHELERGDRGVHELPAVVLAPAIGQETRVDPRMEGLDPPIEHLGRAGHGRHVGDRQARRHAGRGPSRRSTRARSRGRRDPARARPVRSCPRPTAAPVAGT